MDETRRVFVHTEAFSRAERQLHSKGYVVITGQPGMGKTSLGHALLRHFSTGPRPSSNLSSTSGIPEGNSSGHDTSRNTHSDAGQHFTAGPLPSGNLPPTSGIPEREDSSSEDTSRDKHSSTGPRPNSDNLPPTSGILEGNSSGDDTPRDKQCATGQQFTPLIVKSFEEWRQHVGGDGRYHVVLLDGTLGEERLDHDADAKWQTSYQTILSYAHKRKCLTIFTFNQEVLKEMQVKKPDLKLFQDDDVDLSTIQYSNREKRDMVRNHFVAIGKQVPEDIDDVLKDDTSGPLFPSFCAKLADHGGDTQGGDSCSYWNIITLDIPRQSSIHRQRDAKTSKTFVGYSRWQSSTSSQKITKNKDKPDSLNIFDNETPLISACRRNAHQEVKELLQQGKNPNIPGSSGITALHVASFAGALQMVKDLIDHDADPDAKDITGWTPLHLASQEGHAPVVHTLLSKVLPAHGVKTQTRCVDSCDMHTDLIISLTSCSRNNKRQPGKATVCGKCLSQHEVAIDNLSRHNAFIDRLTQGGVTALYLACQNGHTQVAKLLLEHGACAEVIWPLYKVLQFSALDVACCHGHTEVVRLLLNYRASLSPQLVHAACSRGHAEVVGLLIDQLSIADLERDGYGQLPLHIASQLGHTHIVQLLLEKTKPENIDARTSNEKTSLHLACEGRNANTVKLLLKHGASITSTYSRMTPLLIACQNCDYEIFSILSDHGAPFDYKDDAYGTLLHVACSAVCWASKDGSGGSKQSMKHSQRPAVDRGRASQRTETAQKLLDAGLDVNATTGQGKTALHAACENETADLPLVSALLQHATFVDTIYNGSTALHAACKNKWADAGIVATLLRHGASVHAYNISCLTPLQLSRQNGSCQHEDIMKILLEHGAEFTENGDFKPLGGFHGEIILAYMDEHDCTNSKGDPALHILIQYYNKQLIENHVRLHCKDIDVRDRKGRTALMVAIKNGRDDAANVLLDNGASIETRDHRGWSPARFCIDKDQIPLLDRLLQDGAAVDETDDCGNTLLHQACLTRDHWSPRTDSDKLLGPLMAGGCSVNSVNNEGNSPLHLACMNEQHDSIVTLLANGALVHLKNKSGLSPMDLAQDVNSYPGYLHLFPPCDDYLTHSDDSQSDHDQSDTENENDERFDDEQDMPSDTSPAVKTPILDSRQCDTEEESRDHSNMLSGISANTAVFHSSTSETEVCKSSIHNACFHGNTGRVVALMQRSESVHTLCEHGRTPLHYACCMPHVATARALLLNGAQVNAASDKGRTPLHDASARGDAITVDLLLKYGAVVDSGASDGRTALHLACGNGHCAAASLLWTNQADVHSVDRDGDTALHMACAAGHVDVSLLLLHWGADLTARNLQSHTAMDLAQAALHGTLVNILMRRQS